MNANKKGKSRFCCSRPQGLAEHRRQRKHRSEVCGFLGSPYGAPAHRKVPGVRPGLFAEQDAQRKVAPSGAAFLLVTFLWPRKEKSPAVGQPPTSTRRPQGGSIAITVPPRNQSPSFRR